MKGVRKESNSHRSILLFHCLEYLCIDKLGIAKGSGGVFPGIELGRSQVLAAVEGKLKIASKEPRDVDELLNSGTNACGKHVAVLLQQRADVMDLRDLDAGGSQQGLQGDFHKLLRFTHHICPAFLIHEHVQGLEPV